MSMQLIILKALWFKNSMESTITTMATSRSIMKIDKKLYLIAQENKYLSEKIYVGISIKFPLTREFERVEVLFGIHGGRREAPSCGI